MDIGKVLTQLRSELDHINAAIESLEKLQRGARRSGRPRTVFGNTVSGQGADAASKAVASVDRRRRAAPQA